MRLMGAEHVNDKDRPMPPLIAFAGALGGLAVVRWAYKTAVRINGNWKRRGWPASPRPPPRAKFPPSGETRDRRVPAGLGN